MDDESYYVREQILSFIGFDSSKNDYYANNPANTIIKDGNGELKTINHLYLNIGNNIYDTIYIDGLYVFYELLNKSNDDRVLLKIKYKDDGYNRGLSRIHEEKLIKYIEGNLILGFDKFMPDFQKYPNYFLDTKYNDIDD